MIDSVLKGNGNSRFLKSAVPAGTSWADALAMLQAGTFPIDFNGINTEGFQQVGTPLNKANLLKDATAAQIGLPPSTTPDGMFQALGNTGELHVWRKTVTSGTGTYSLGAVQEGLHYIKWANNSATSDSSGTFEYGSEIAVNNDGTITGIKNPSTITIKPWDDDASKANVFKGKFIKMISQVETSMSHFKIGEIWWIPADAVMTKDLLNGESNRWYIAASKRQQVIGVPARTTTTYPVSTNPNAYQEGSDVKEAGYTLGEVENNVQILSGGDNWPTTLYYADSVDVDNEGHLSLQSPSQYTFTTSSQYQNVSTLAVGRFIKIVPEASSGFLFRDGIWFVPSDATVTVSNYKIYASKIQKVTVYAAIPAGTTIEYLGKLGDKARVQVVSYVGTGTYGESNPNSLTFDFVPKMVMFLRYYKSGITQSGALGSYGSDSRVITPESLTTTYARYNGFGDKSYSYAKKSKDGKTIFWYNDSSYHQGNDSGYIYYFLVIG